MQINNDPVFVRRRRVALAAILVVLLLLAWGCSRIVGDDAEAAPGTPGATATSQPSLPFDRTPEQEAPPEEPAQPLGPAGEPLQTRLTPIQRITGEGLTPKSVVASPQGLVFAQNMMYSHSVTAYRPDGARMATIDDAVDLGELGIEGHPGRSKGAPVEMAFSPDGTKAWVSNYAMYGEGFSPEGADACTSDEGISPSYVYEIDTSTLAITRVVEVGAVPKYVAVTPDGKQVLVTNWCSMSLSVIDAETATVTRTIPLEGRHPRGVVVSPDSATAYVAIMGSDRTVSVDLASGRSTTLAETGRKPRHLLLSPDGSRLYISDSGSATVTVVDPADGTQLGRATVGEDPRSMVLSPDGSALYVANYGSAGVSKLDASSLKVIQTLEVSAVPIGITYEPTKKRVWVACYNGSIDILDDAHQPAA